MIIMKRKDLLNKIKSSDYLESMSPENVKKRAEERRLIEAPFIEDLRRNGYPEIENASEILGLRKMDKKLSTLLIKWIPEISDAQHSQETLVRALALSKSSFDGKALTELFDSNKSSYLLKWAIANTIASAKVENIEDWLEKKTFAFRLGKEHEMLVYAIMKYFNPEKASALLKKLFDTFPLQVSDALSKIGTHSDLVFLENKFFNYLGEGKSEIKGALKKLKKKLG